MFMLLAENNNKKFQVLPTFAELNVSQHNFRTDSGDTINVCSKKNVGVSVSELHFLKCAYGSLHCCQMNEFLSKIQ
jgi:hypothetical protein